jgi:hypothetical protein
MAGSFFLKPAPVRSGAGLLFHGAKAIPAAVIWTWALPPMSFVPLGGGYILAD